MPLPEDEFLGEPRVIFLDGCRAGGMGGGILLVPEDCEWEGDGGGGMDAEVEIEGVGCGDGVDVS